MVSLFVEVPEDLHQLIQKYLDRNPEWDQDRVFQAALSLFLVQNGGTEKMFEKPMMTDLPGT